VPRALERLRVKDLVQAWGNAAGGRMRPASRYGAARRSRLSVDEFLPSARINAPDEYGGSEETDDRFIIEAPNRSARIGGS